MANDEHRLMSTPVSVNDGLKRADGRTWLVLGGGMVLAGLVVLAINLFVPKPKVHWPTSSSPQRLSPAAGEQAPASQEEPKTYDVAPPRQQPRGGH